MNETIEEAGGAVFGWAWCRYVGQFFWAMKYWPATARAAGARPYSPVVDQNKGRFFGGHRDWTRGRHWDRRQRYGRF